MNEDRPCIDGVEVQYTILLPFMFENAHNNKCVWGRGKYCVQMTQTRTLPLTGL